MADLCLIPQVYNANRFKVNMDDYPKIVEIMSNLNDLSELRPAHPDEQGHVPYPCTSGPC